jgi:hypothetical protein
LCLRAQLTAEDHAPADEKIPMNGSHVNVAFEGPSTLHSHPKQQQDEQAAGSAEPFEDYDDTGVYNYGIFVRDRCSRCRRSRIVRCTRF